MIRNQVVAVPTPDRAELIANIQRLQAVLETCTHPQLRAVYESALAKAKRRVNWGGGNEIKAPTYQPALSVH